MKKKNKKKLQQVKEEEQNGTWKIDGWTMNIQNI